MTDIGSLIDLLDEKVIRNAEFVFYTAWSQWIHPESFVRILDADMPWELKPEVHND